MTVVAPNLCARKCSLTVAHTLVSENNTYAVLFDGSGDSASFGTRLPDEVFTYSGMQGDGGDICFTSDSAGTTRLPMEVVSINNGTKQAEIWVAVSLSITTDATIYVWYHSSGGTLTQPAAAAAYGSQAVWTTVGNLGGVWHLNNVNDSSSNANNLTNGNSVTFPAGKIGGGALFSSGTQTLQAANSLPTSNFSVQCWNYATTLSNSCILGQYNSANDNFIALLLSTSFPPDIIARIAAVTDDWLVPSSYPASPPKSIASVWENLAITVSSASGGTGYRNFLYSATPYSYSGTGGNAKTFSWGASKFNIGSKLGSNSAFSGTLDEVRVSTVVRSQNFVATDYAIQSSTTLVTVGTPASAVLTFLPGLFASGVYQGAA